MPQHAALRLFVKRLASRSSLTNDEVGDLLSLGGHLRRYAVHADLVRPGERVDDACLVVDGLVGRFGQNGDGLRQISALFIAGDMADLPSVVSPRAGWGITTLTPTTILRIPHAELRRLTARHPGVADAFWRDCVADGSIVSEWVVNVGRRNALSRIAHLLCEMALRCEQAGLGDRASFPLPITQWDLADATGLTSVHVNRTLQEMRAAGIADLRAGVVTIHDWNTLVSVGDFDAGFLLLDSEPGRITDAA